MNETEEVVYVSPPIEARQAAPSSTAAPRVRPCKRAATPAARALVRRGVTIRQIHRAAQAKGLPYGYDELARAVRGSYRYDLRQFIAEQLGKSVEQLWPER